MTIKLDLSPEAEAKLREQAAASGKDVENFVRHVVEEKLAAGAATCERSVEEWLRLFHEWIASHPKREGVHMDDSRESIYAGRDE